MKFLIFQIVGLLLMHVTGGRSNKLRSSSGSNKMAVKFPPDICSDSSYSPSRCQLPNYAATHANRTRLIGKTAHGIPYPSLTASRTIGTRGHVLLEDSFLIENLQAFNRERIPSRVVHAKGAAAMGYFEVTNDVTKYTKADFLSKVGKKTNVAVRFSTLVGESGSADTVLDPRGFAVKFYTQDGIYDLVGNNIQVFAINDPMLFPHMMRSKRNPQTHSLDHTSTWDFLSLRPESTMQVLLLSLDSARPKSWRYMDGAGVNTFKMMNGEGVSYFVKFHWISNQKNKKYFTLNESTQMAGENSDFMTEELFDSIARKEYPSWKLQIQVMPCHLAGKHPQNPFDPTKFWKPEHYPMITVGKLILNKNPDDFFTQVEQLAFSPSHMVPGIEPSPDRVLQARMFAYPDTQLYRLGVNFAQIPVNKCPFQVNTYQRDGLMNVGTNGAGAPNYFPNSFNGLSVMTGNYAKESISQVSGELNRVDLADDDNFSLPRWYLKQLTADERESIMATMVSSLGKAHTRVQQNYLNNVAYRISGQFGDRLKELLLKRS